MDPSSQPSQMPPAHPLRRSGAKIRGRLVVVAALALATAGIGWAIRRAASPAPRVETIGYTDLLTRSAAGEVAKAEIDGDHVLLQLKGGGTASAVVANAHSQHAIVTLLAER